MYASNGGSMSNGDTMCNGGGGNVTKPLNEPWWFTQTLGIFGSKVVNA